MTTHAHVYVRVRESGCAREIAVAAPRLVLSPIYYHAPGDPQGQGARHHLEDSVRSASPVWQYFTGEWYGFRHTTPRCVAAQHVPRLSIGSSKRTLSRNKITDYDGNRLNAFQCSSLPFPGVRARHVCMISIMAIGVMAEQV